MKHLFATFALATMTSTAALAEVDGPHACLLPADTVRSIQASLDHVVNAPDANGGIFKPNRMWSAVVDRAGTLCSVHSVGDAWPGSRAIAIAKAGTANDFNNSGLALSTANLYAPTQPGGSLYGLNNSNPFNPEYNRETTEALPGSGVGHPAGGIITFGGGVALYSGGKVIGGIGVSGDSACADHSIAYRMRKLVSLDGIPGGVGAGGTDNILYAPAGTVPTGFQHPHCFPTDLTADQIASYGK